MTTTDNKLIGRHILVGLTYLNRTGMVTRQIQLHGHITATSGHLIHFERADGEGEFSIPDDGSLGAAHPDAVYRLRSTGEAVTGVDFVASWTIHSRSGDN